MKTKLTIVMALGIITLAFVFKTPESSIETHNVSGISASNSPSITGNISDKFLIGTMDNGAEPDYNTLTGDLRFNLWHKYINGGLDGNGQFQIYGWNYTTDLLTSPIGVYKTDVQNIITGNNDHSMRTLMERPKTTRLAFGQRSDYQCEDMQHVEEGLWFYSFRSPHHTGNDVEDTDPLYGSNSWVRRCLVNQNQTDGGAGWVVSGLRANREQANRNERWEGDRSYSWIVKPKIRADRDYIINHFDEEICRIDVINYEGDLIKSTILRARHFQDINGDYDGKYKEEGFSFNTLLNDSDLTFSQPEAINFNPAGKDYYAPDGVCKVDFRVYWYGNCDMWIDYVRVDNDVADLLFKGYYDDPNHPEREWIKWEALDIARHTDSPLKFYIEEFEFNNIPCMAYVSRKLRQHNPAIGLMCDLNYTAYNTVVPFPDWDHVFDNYLGVEHIKRYLIDSVGSTEIFMGSYPFGGSPPGSDPYAISKIPQTLSALPYNEQTGMLRQTTSVQDYDNWLQLHLDDTYHQFWSYRSWTARADSLSKLADIPFINLLQTHLWKDGGYRLAEPTNEETDLMTNLAVSWGARGVLHFMYTGWGCLPTTNSGGKYGRGLTNPNPCNNPNPFDVVLQSPAQITYSPRLTNVYDQPKWQKIGEIDRRLEKWGPYLMSFDNTNRQSYIYRLERDDMKLNTYIHDIYI